MDLTELAKVTQSLIHDVLDKTGIGKGQLFILGLSSSEVNGGVIGHASSAEIGEVIVGTIYDVLKKKGIALSVQGCEHINRAVLLEAKTAEKLGLEPVNVVPQLHAGGSGQVAAYKLFKHPVEVESVQAFAGLDIGDTAISHYVKAVQIPVRPEIRELGGAHVTALTSRPKKIGGERAKHF
ncbi:MAG: TIGR01440 family protein [Streptococcaceae bacterium]|jgi:uncharacterized protein (TIGR01440 family)|nr:TIGR01440 family protein [Streptococcaceae bacterium]